MTSVPDYISPIIGYRVWQWDAAGLRSLNGESWRPGKLLEARCKVCEFAWWRSGHKAEHSSHTAPDLECTCGIYASKALERLHRRPRFERFLIYGQVSLWGTLVEHEHGWRAQFAYPKSFFLPPAVLPVTLTKIEGWLETLISYQCDTFIVHDGAMLPLWQKDSGFAAVGLDYLTRRATQWYTQRNQGNTIEQGDQLLLPGWE